MPAASCSRTAAGDALGAGYEFGPPLPDDAPVTMRGGGACNWAPGEWTDDTAMAIAIAEVAATGADLRSVDAQDQIVARWVGWSRTAPDVGIQTRRVLGRVLDGGACRQRPPPRWRRRPTCTSEPGTRRATAR